MLLNYLLKVLFNFFLEIVLDQTTKQLIICLSRKYRLKKAISDF